MSLLVQEAALRQLRKEEKAMVKRRKILGEEPAVVMDEISDYDRASFGRAVRIEIDVCVPLSDLRKMLQDARNEINNALVAMDRGGPPNDQRHAAHRALSRAKGAIYYQRQKVALRLSRKPAQS